MPISKEKKKLYPENWKQISWQIRAKAGNKCEICDAENGKPHPKTGSKVVLTVHHLDFNPKNNLGYNLIALCQRCHIRLDAKKKAFDRAKKVIMKYL
jgi:5-methylcytosine-specific restriction endonuclease McrA